MKKRCRAVLTEGLRQHPAVRAWAVATSLETTPDCIYVLSRERRPSAVYRLAGLGVDGTAVFAKRSLPRVTMIEQIVYEEVLPELPLTAPRYYGICISEPYGWIFMEDVGDENYSASDPEQRELAARWVGTLHIRAARIAIARSLPDAGPARYLEYLRFGRNKIRRSLRSWPFPPNEVAILARVLSRCDAIEARWARVEAVCQGPCCTMVHGDFRPQNVYVRRDGVGLNLCPIDWEKTGFGLPAVDLTRIDLAVYWSVVRSTWPELDFATVSRLATAGRLLRAIAAVNWMSESLTSDNAAGRSKAVADLESVDRRLTEAAGSTSVLG